MAKRNTAKPRLRRPKWDEYFMALAWFAAARSTCLSRAVGAILVKGTRVLMTGYNGQTPGSPHCEDMGCLREAAAPGTKLDECRVVHAEINVITFAAKNGIPTDNTTLYCTHYPCYACAKNLISAGVKKVVYLIPYPSERTAKEFAGSSVEVKYFFNLVPYNSLDDFGKVVRSFLQATMQRMKGRSAKNDQSK